MSSCSCSASPRSPARCRASSTRSRSADRIHKRPAPLPRWGEVLLCGRASQCYALSMPAPILPLIDAVAHWPARGALIGLDLGTKTIGVAVSDPDRRLATAVETIQRTAFRVDAARLLAIAGERKAVGFVLGL